MVGVAALAAMNATAQLRSSFGRSAQDDIPPEVAEKIPEDCRDLVEKEIHDKASKEATAEAEEKFNILFVPGVWTNNCGKSVLFWVQSRGVFMCKYDKDGRLVQTGARNDFEEWRWRDARQKAIIGELWKNQPVVDAILSNAVAKVAEERRSPRRRVYERALMELEKLRHAQTRIGGRVRQERLEELIPLEEAMELAKDGKGKGYFQLALRYAGGNELPRDSKLAYQMLCKARDLDYANAVLVEGLCDECELCTPSMRFGGCSWVDKSSAMIDYCGVSFWSPFGSRRRRMGECDSLTNEVAFARVMGKYEKAKTLGALAATNQIAALNKRLADFNAEKAECDRAKAKADANNRKVMDLQGMKESGEDAEKNPLDELRSQIAAERRKLVMSSEEPDREEKQKTETARAKYRAAFKEMFGYEMGEKIAQEGTSGEFAREMKKAYRYFTSLDLEYEDGCLWRVTMTFGSQGKYSLRSLKKEADAVKKDLEKRYDVPVDFESWMVRNGWQFLVRVSDSGISVRIADEDLHEKLGAKAQEKVDAQRVDLQVFEKKR